MPEDARADDLGRIPLRLRVGVTGHLELDDPTALADQVRSALEEIQTRFRQPDGAPRRLAVISPLAEGADQLVADQVLRSDDAVLIVPLPLSRDEYLKRSFKTEEARSHFQTLLLDRRAQVISPPEGLTPDESFEQVGHYVVDQCDVLLALWDGRSEAGQGGTATVVAYARARSRPLYIIPTDGKGSVRIENLDASANALDDVIAEIDRYNAEKVSSGHLTALISKWRLEVVSLADRVGLDPARIQLFSAWITPFYIRADILAGRLQRNYNRFFLGVFFMAASAVAVAAFQALFAKSVPEVAGIEVLLMVAVLGLVLLGQRWKLHSRWIASRFLAERFRAAFFLALVGVGGRKGGGEVSLGHEAEAWLTRAVDEAYLEYPDDRPGDRSLEPLRRMLGEGWLLEQISYHERKRREFESRNQLLGVAIAFLFAATLIAAMLHGLSSVLGIHETLVLGFSLSDSLVLLAIVLPAFGGALSALRVQREFSRLAERYTQVVPILGDALARIEGAKTLDDLQVAALQAQAVVLSENHEWFGVVKFHELEVHV